jgi:hypothetical protein
MEDELEELLLHAHGRRSQMLTDAVKMPRRIETLKTLLPWLVTAGLFLWQAGGSWAKVARLEETIRTDYVSKDAFEPVARDVRDIKQFLMGRGRASHQEDQ